MSANVPASLVRTLARSPLAVPLKRMVRRLRESYYNAEVLSRIQIKTRPLPLASSPAERRRVNLIIPEINFANFYGGYIAKFNLARRLAERGFAVRLLIVDQCTVDRAAWAREIRRYGGLEQIFEQVEVSYCFARDRQIPVHPGDAFIATTWWTAYIAHAAITALERERFVYLIQEYEPFTFPMGSYYAMAHESYRLPHHAVFSSALLEEYFRESHIGVYGESAGDAGAPMHFENAILRFAAGELRVGARSPRRLLFYARPEAHASRNMFEIGYQALVECIEQGVFDGEPWELYGIGTPHGDIPLPRGRRLRMLGKVSLNEYRALLLDHDVGMSLMYTPHPSLLPLEMAAAGMLVVSNECLNKTAAKLAAISGNIIAGGPTVAGVAASLRDAVAAVGDGARRRDGAQVRWSSSWDDTFDGAFMERLEIWLQPTTH